MAQDEMKFKQTFDAFYGDNFVVNHYLKFFKFSENCDLYMKTIQNFLVSQSHYLYAYHRSFLCISRTNYYIDNHFKVLNLLQIF